MRPSSFLTLFALITTTIFAAPLNLTSSITSSDSDISLQRRNLDQTCVYWAVMKNMGEKVHPDNHNVQMNYLTKDFENSPAIVTKMTGRTILDIRTIYSMLRNLETVGQLIRVAVHDPPRSKLQDLDDWQGTDFYIVTKNVGVPAKALNSKAESLPELRKQARDEYREKFKLIYPGGKETEEEDYVYEFMKESKKLKANIVGVDWAFALPVGHADPGEPEIFV